MADCGLRGAVVGKVTLSGYVLTTKTGLPKILAALPEHIRLTNAEPGCIMFEVTQDDDNFLQFNVYEEFESKADFEKHQARVAGTAWSAASKGLEKFYEIS